MFFFFFKCELDCLIGTRLLAVSLETFPQTKSTELSSLSTSFAPTLNSARSCSSSPLSNEV